MSHQFPICLPEMSSITIKIQVGSIQILLCIYIYTHRQYVTTISPVPHHYKNHIKSFSESSCSIISPKKNQHFLGTTTLFFQGAPWLPHPHAPPSKVVPILSPSFRAKRRRGAAHCGHLKPCCRSSWMKIGQ